MGAARFLSLAVIVVALLAAAGCQEDDEPQPTPAPAAAASPASPAATPVGPAAFPVMTPPARPFSDEVRQAIYKEALRAEERANQEAVAANPDASTLAGGGNPEKDVRRIQKRGRVSEALQQKYRAEIATRYGISEIELRAIVDEGRLKKWPTPSP